MQKGKETESNIKSKILGKKWLKTHIINVREVFTLCPHFWCANQVNRDVSDLTHCCWGKNLIFFRLLLLWYEFYTAPKITRSILKPQVRIAFPPCTWAHDKEWVTVCRCCRKRYPEIPAIQKWHAGDKAKFSKMMCVCSILSACSMQCH